MLGVELRGGFRVWGLSRAGFGWLVPAGWVAWWAGCMHG